VAGCWIARNVRSEANAQLGKAEGDGHLEKAVVLRQ
jgi:hypothetical protein